MASKPYRNYVVTITPTVRVAGRSDQPEEMEFSARTGADAIKQAREHMTNTVGHDVKTEGKLAYRARLV